MQEIGRGTETFVIIMMMKRTKKVHKILHENRNLKAYTSRKSNYQVNSDIAVNT